MKLTSQGLLLERISFPRMAWFLVMITMVWHLLYITSSDFHRSYVIGSDGAGYYAYLPATFIYHDHEYKFCQPGEQKVNYPACDFTLFMNRTFEGKLVNKYFIGTAVLELPFFLAAYASAPAFGFPADGYSFPFQIAIAIAAIFYVLLGLEQIRRLLQKMQVKEYAQAIVILLLFFGTNLYQYTLREPGMSHAYSFCMVALLLNQSWNLFHAQKKNAIMWTLFALTMIIMIRPVNGVMALALPLIAGSWKNFVEGIRFSFRHYWRLAIGVSFFLLMIFIQLLMYKKTTGSWIVDSYSGEHLNLREPNIMNVLFSWRKGWFIYTPLMLFAVAGIFFLNNWFRRIAIVLFLAVNIWVVSSWELWTYGGSIGMRPFIESYAVLAIPLALFVQATFRKFWLAITVPVFGFIVLLNLVQHYQFTKGILPYDGMTEARYRKIFFETHPHYTFIYDPGTLRQHTLPFMSEKVSTWTRTFEEDTTYRMISFWGITDEKSFEGKHAAKLGEEQTTAGLCLPLRKGVPDTSLIPKAWMVVRAKVFLVDEQLTPKMAVSVRYGENTLYWDSPPLFFRVDTVGKWQDYIYAAKIPANAPPDSEVCVFLIHDDKSVAYADNIQATFYIDR